MIIVIHIYNRITIGTTTIAPVPPPATNPDNNDKEVVFENFASFTDCKSEINNTQIDNAKDIDVVMPMYNLCSSALKRCWNIFPAHRLFIFFFSQKIF